jgi:hypothetical protein
VNYNFASIEMGMNLVVLISELESPSFPILMFLKISQGELMPQGAKQSPTCILDSFNNFLKVLIDELLNALPPCKKVDHKIEMVVGAASLLSKAPYKLNQKELKELNR